MNLIAADIGNSTTWLAIEPNQIVPVRKNRILVDGMQELAVELPDQRLFWSICSVNSNRCGQLCDWIEANRPEDRIHVILESDIAMDSLVESRQQTGRDRLVAASMAVQIAGPDRPIVVVDAGTAVTIDLIGADQVFQGGVIFPGAGTCLAALAAATDALPDLSDEPGRLDFDLIMEDLIGRNTVSAILKGVYHSQCAAIIQLVESIAGNEEIPAAVIATGGEIQRFRPYLPRHWTIVDDLVLQGALMIGRALRIE